MARGTATDGNLVVSQRQDGTNDQLATLLPLAEERGLYDAADWLNQRGPRKAGVPAALDTSNRSHLSLREQLLEVDAMAVTQGCYDASDLIREHLPSD